MTGSGIERAPVSVVIPTPQRDGRDRPAAGSAGGGGGGGAGPGSGVADGGSRDDVAGVAEACGALRVCAPPGRRRAAAGRGGTRRRVPGCCSCMRTPCSERTGPKRCAGISRPRRRRPPASPCGSGRAGFRAGWWRVGPISAPACSRCLMVTRDCWFPGNSMTHAAGFPTFRFSRMSPSSGGSAAGGCGRLGCIAMTDAGRYRREGWILRGGRNLLCLALYALGVPPARIAALYAGKPAP